MAKRTITLPKKTVDVFLNGTANPADKAEFAKAFRAASQEAADNDLSHLSDVQIHAIATSIHDKDHESSDDADVARIQALIDAEPEHHETGEEGRNAKLPGEITVTSDAAAALRAATTMAGYLDKTDFTQHAITAERAKDDNQDVPIVFANDMIKGASNDGGVEYAAFWKENKTPHKALVKLEETTPVPGTVSGKSGNKFPDRFSIPVAVVTQAGTTEERNRQTSYFKETYNRTARGKQVLATLNILGDSTALAKHPELGPRFANNPKALEIEMKRLNSHLTNGANKMRQAAKVVRKMAEVAGIPGSKLVVYIARDVDKTGSKVERLVPGSGKPIRVAVEGNFDESKAYSIADFLRLRPHMIGTNLTIAGLDATKPAKAKRGTKADSTRAGDTKEGTNPTVKEAGVMFTRLSNAMTDEDWSGKFDKQLETDDVLLLQAWDMRAELNYRLGEKGAYRLRAERLAEARRVEEAKEEEERKRKQAA